MEHDEMSIYESIGGEATFNALVDCFYDKVEADDTLRPIFPEDLAPGKHWQKLFLIQVFGGPAWYSEARGHPRLRMRHMPYPIDEASRDAWLGHMLAAIDDVGIPEPARSAMRAYFERGAAFMVNVYPPPDASAEG